MIDNAVSYYLNLINVQGVDPERAVEHARLRYGVSESDLRERIAGRVADPEATRKALAAIRDRLVNDSDAEADVALLSMIYEAITGETPERPRRSDSCPWCEDDPAGQRWLCPNKANHEVIESEPGAPGNDDPDERHGYDS